MKKRFKYAFGLSLILTGLVLSIPTADAQQPVDNNANHWVKKAGEKINKNDDKGAIDDLNRAIALDPKFATAYVERGNAELDLGLYTVAIADYGKAIALDPEDGSAYFDRGYTKKVMGNYSGAREDFKLAFKYDPKQFQLFFDTGMKRIKAGLYDRALLVFDHAIDVNPAFGDAFNARGYCCYKSAKTKADYIKALNDFDAGIKLGGSNYEPFFKYRDSVVIAMNKATRP